MPEPLSGIVLAGGRSRRVGSDKALLPLFEGRPLIAIVIEKLTGVCDEIIVVTDVAGRYADLNLPARLVSDDIAPGQGPLAGLHAGLRAMSSKYGLAVACDMPFLNGDLLRYMAGLPCHYQALVPRVRGRWQPLHAIYAKSCLPVIEEVLARGDKSVIELFGRIRVQALGYEEWRPLDPQGLSFFNLNRAADIARAEALWQNLPAGRQG